MGQKAKSSEINFNYPIPKTLHHRVKMFSAEHSIPVKDVVIQALIHYLDTMTKLEDEEL